MGKFSDDDAIEAAVQASEDAYLAAQEAVRANPGDEATEAAYRQTRDEFAAARQTARGDREIAIIAEGEE